MEALVKNWKPIDAWSGDRPSRVAALAPNAIEINAGAKDITARISSMIDGSVYLLTNLPDFMAMDEGRDIREFDPMTWQLLPLQKRVDLGYVKVEPHQKVKGEFLSNKSELELMRDKLIATPSGYKIVDSGGKLSLEQMSEPEMLDAKVITLQTVADARCASVDAEWRRRLKEVGFAFGKHHFPLDDTALAAYRDQYDDVKDGVATVIIARAIENVDIEITKAAEFMAAKSAGVKAHQDAKVAAKTAIRSATTYKAVIDAFSKYMGA
jgi:hypothetical protein